MTFRMYLPLKSGRGLLQVFFVLLQISSIKIHIHCHIVLNVLCFVVRPWALFVIYRPTGDGTRMTCVLWPSRFSMISSGVLLYFLGSTLAPWNHRAVSTTSTGIARMRFPLLWRCDRPLTYQCNFNQNLVCVWTSCVGRGLADCWCHLPISMWKFLQWQRETSLWLWDWSRWSLLHHIPFLLFFQKAI